MSRCGSREGAAPLRFRLEWRPHQLPAGAWLYASASLKRRITQGASKAWRGVRHAPRKVAELIIRSHARRRMQSGSPPIERGCRLQSGWLLYARHVSTVGWSRLPGHMCGLARE